MPRVLLIAVLAALLLPASASAQGFDRILIDVSAQVTHGDADDTMPLEDQKERYYRGEHLDLLCGHVVLLAQSVLADHGYASRQAAAITRSRFNYRGDGHTMIEVWTGRRWIVYDLSFNRQPRDARGRAINVVQFVKQERAGKSHNFRILASDQAFDFSLKSMYRRRLGVALLEIGPGEFAFAQRAQRKRLERYSPSYRWLAPKAFRRATRRAPGAWLTPR